MAFYSRDGFSCQCNIKNKCDGCNGKYIMPTKGDQIRSMTDEELADWLGVYCNAQKAQEVGKPCVSGIGSCEECWLDWLKQECEE